MAETGRDEAKQDNQDGNDLAAHDGRMEDWMIGRRLAYRCRSRFSENSRFNASGGFRLENCNNHPFFQSSILPGIGFVNRYPDLGRIPFASPHRD
jgi:hypothetical protein